MPVFFHFNNTHPVLKDRRSLKSFVESVFKKQGIQLGRLTYVFCTDVFLLGINREFLHHDTYTDILTFDLSEEPGICSGEIYISVDRVRENAASFNVSFTEEFHLVIFHGALHLCGFGDKTPQEKKIMRQKENELLKRYLHKN